MKMLIPLPFLLLAAAPAPAQEGADLFATYCAACHGETAEGAGPMTPVLLTEPPDLTRLSERAGGTFPTFEVVRRIDGRDPLLAHGADMPLWGEFFEGEGTALPTEAGQPILTSAPIAALVEWLSEQQK